jgi:hypothetical protein
MIRFPPVQQSKTRRGRRKIVAPELEATHFLDQKLTLPLSNEILLPPSNFTATNRCREIVAKKAIVQTLRGAIWQRSK